MEKRHFVNLILYYIKIINYYFFYFQKVVCNTLYIYPPNKVDSLKVCHEVGNRGENSTAILSVSLDVSCADREIHMIPANIITPTILINLPEDLTTFHVDIASG